MAALTPAEAACRMAWALALGGVLGMVYGFLRPLRPRHTGLSDGIFLLAAGWVWLYLCFGVCAGDIRLGCDLALLAGGILWEITVGRALRPFCRGFWKILARVWGLLQLPAKKIFVFLKFLFASGKKSGTIIGKYFMQHRKPRRGKQNERIQNGKVQSKVSFDS